MHATPNKHCDSYSYTFWGAGNFRGQKGGRACLPSPITRIGRDFNPVVVVVLSYHDYIDFRFAMTQL